MRGGGAINLLFCDYEGEYRFSEVLSRIGYLVDHIRPDALRHVNVGDHSAFIFSFSTADNERLALATVEKLKQAELPTALILMHFGEPSQDFSEHMSKEHCADAYIIKPQSEGALLDEIDKVAGCPFPPNLRGSWSLLREDKDRQAQNDFYRGRVEELEKRINELEGEKSKTEEELEEQRKSMKPKLQALLKGQKLQFQSETERLKSELAEMEAKLMDREVKLREYEAAQERQRNAFEEITIQHEKSQQALREFYQKKLKSHSIDDSE